MKVDTEGAAFDIDKVWVAAIRRLASRDQAYVTRLNKKVSASLDRGAGPPPLAPDCQVWAPLMYFEYETLSRVAARRSDVYLDLLQLLEASGTP